MEFSGKIIHALELRQGVSPRSGNSWMSQSFVIESHDQYPRRMVFDVFGEDRLKEFHIEVGEELTVSFDMDAREYQGRWFNSIRAWRVDRVQPGQMAVPPAPAAGYAPAAPQAQPGYTPASAAPAAAPAPAPAPQPANPADDLPF